MASQVGGNLDLIETGPTKITYKGLELGHTIDGFEFNIQPQLRERFVDEYGTHVVDLIHTGDEVTATTTFAQKTLQVLQTVYQMSYGAVSSTVVGIGRIPGRKSRSRAGLLLIHPLDGDSTNDDVQFWKAAVTSPGAVQFGTINNDRVFQTNFRMLIDPDKEDGSLIGQIGVSAM